MFLHKQVQNSEAFYKKDIHLPRVPVPASTTGLVTSLMLVYLWKCLTNYLKSLGYQYCPRQGGPYHICLERFEEDLHDTSARLTYSAFSGVRKQSVEDVERLFGQSVIAWMKEKGYHSEAEYLQYICNWRRVCDERGLTDDQRSKFNKELLGYILNDLMPWHSDDLQDLSLLEVNRHALFSEIRISY